MLLILLNQFNYIQGAQAESDSSICMKVFQQKIAGSLPDDIFMGGARFQSLALFRVKDRETFRKSLWNKAISSMFVPVIETKDRLVFIRPTEKMKVTIGDMSIYRFTHYLYVYYPEEDRVCLFEFTPLGG